MSRAALSLLVAQVPIWLLADLTAPYTSSFAYESVVQKVSEQLASDKDRSAKHVSELAQHFNLAWLHLTDKNKLVSASNRPAGLTEAGAETSRVLEVKGSRFVEISRNLPEGILTLGFRSPSLIENLFNKGIYPPQLPVGELLLALVLNGAVCGGIYWVFMGRALWTVMGRLENGQDPNDEFPPYVTPEIKRIVDGVFSRSKNLQEEHERNIAAARTDLSGVHAKEKEERFSNNLLKDLLSQTTSKEAAELVLRRVSDEYIGVIKAAFALDFGPSGAQYRLLSDWGFSDDQKKTIANLGSSRFISLIQKIHSVVGLAGDEYSDKKLEQIGIDLACDQCFICPIANDGQTVAYMCFWVSNKDQNVVQKMVRNLKKLSEQIIPVWSLIANLEVASYYARHDHLTGMRNKIYLDEVLATLKAPSYEEGKPCTLLLAFEGDNFSVMLNSYGPRTIDKLISELSQQILTGIGNNYRFKKASSRVLSHENLYRIAACRFVLILEECTVKKAMELADSVNQAVLDRKDWAHGMPSWSVSCAIAPLNTQIAGAIDCLEEALITLDYIRFRKSTAMVMESKEVPEAFMSRAESRTGSGLGQFDPVALLDTVQKSGKSGVFTVNSSDGRVFWAHLQEGKISKARLGALSGDAAAVEFISTFIDGSYRLQDISTLDSRSAEEVRALGGAYLVKMPIDELLEVAVNVRNTWSEARVRLKTPDMIIHPTIEKQTDQIKNMYHKMGKVPSRLEQQVTIDVWELCNGRFSLEEIVERLEECPIALIWKAADVLMQNKLIKFSRLRVSAYTDSSKEKEQPIASSRKPSRSTADFVALPRACSACRRIDPLSQKFCVHCGAEMAAAAHSE